MGARIRNRAPRRRRGSSYPIFAHKPLKKELATPPSSPDFGTVGRHTSPEKLRPLTKDMSREDHTCNTGYVAAIRPTSSCSQDICEPTSEPLMQVKACKSDDIALSYNHYKIGFKSGYKLTGRIYLG